MFLTALEDFDYKPYVRSGKIVRGEVVTQSALVWQTEYLGSVVISAGFITDLASLPWFTSLLFKKLGKHQRAAVLHDFLYRRQKFTRRYSDKQFKLAMKQDGVARWRRSLIISGLAVGGWVAWNNPSSVEYAE